MKNRREDVGKVIMVVGMQFGSEGKGAVSSYLAPIVSLGVRTGAANAGHTIYFQGERFTMQQIPCTWINPVSKLVIGIGAMISLPILLREINMVSRYLPVAGRLFIDGNAHVIQEEHICREAGTDLASRIGSTSAIAGEGIGAAMAAKALRDASSVRARDVPELRPFIADTVDILNTELDAGQYVLLEGTQGFGLSLEHGAFPFVTSRDTSATALAASVGVSPQDFDTEVIGVVRTYPIRVAGNSGQFDDDSEELTWEEVTHQAKSPVPIIEHTSVTKNIRRVATLSRKGYLRACMVNRPDEIALTFADYLDWSVHEQYRTTPSIDAFIADLEALGGVPVTLIGTGSRSIIDTDEYRRRMLRKLCT